jgi:nucleotide-binding universal stress UspA family protein
LRKIVADQDWRHAVPGEFVGKPAQSCGAPTRDGAAMFKNILVPTDGSKLSQKAVKEAIELAKVTGARLTALHVYPRFSGSPYGTFGPAEDVIEEAHKNQARAEGDQMFAAIRKLTEGAGVALDAVLAENNDVWKQIIATAKKKKCDLICMASHGRRGVSGVLLGSETNKVLTHSDTPVLVLR